MDDFKARGLTEAKEKLSELKLTKKEREEYNRYKEDLHYQASMNASGYGLGKIEGHKEGLEEGEEIGMEKGKEIGREEGKILTATNLILIGQDDAFIMKVTGLSISKIQHIRSTKGL